MARITNKMNLPEALVEAVKNDGYTKGESDFSATGLLKPARQAELMRRHKDEIVEDASDRIWSLIGQAAHTILERANKNDIAEKRYFAAFGDYTVSAQIDSLSARGGVLTDYKVQTVYKFKPNQEPDADWVAQLNIQAEILKRNGVKVNELKIVGILRDWSKMKAKQDRDGYPQSQVVEVHIPLWPSEVTTKFIENKINKLIEARESLPECSKEEMWAKDDKWALMEKGKKRAIKLFDDETIANEMADGISKRFVEHRPGDRTRCEHYCSVAQFCKQFQDYKKGK